MLMQVPVPAALHGRTYGELVSHLLLSPGAASGAAPGAPVGPAWGEPRPAAGAGAAAQAPSARSVPLGLLRRKSENRAWRLPYVAAHPAASTVLEATDAMFILRPRCPDLDGTSASVGPDAVAPGSS